MADAPLCHAEHTIENYSRSNYIVCGFVKIQLFVHQPLTYFQVLQIIHLPGTFTVHFVTYNHQYKCFVLVRKQGVILRNGLAANLSNKSNITLFMQIKEIEKQCCQAFSQRFNLACVPWELSI